jgi:hypothetical protein
MPLFLRNDLEIELSELRDFDEELITDAAVDMHICYSPPSNGAQLIVNAELVAFDKLEFTTNAPHELKVGDGVFITKLSQWTYAEGIHEVVSRTDAAFVIAPPSGSYTPAFDSTRDRGEVYRVVNGMTSILLAWNPVKEVYATTIDASAKFILGQAYTLFAVSTSHDFMFQIVERATSRVG